MKIFKLNDQEWWFAETLAEAYAAAERSTGVTEAEQRADFKPKEIPESEWDKPGEVQLDEDGEMGSYREALENATAGGEKSGFLCGTEW